MVERKETGTADRLGLTFHRTFALSRDMLRQLLASAKKHEKITFAILRDDTTLGTVQVQAVRRYAYGVGLCGAADTLSHFGDVVNVSDPGITLLATQWLLHYHLSAPHRSGPAAWNHLVNSRLLPGDVLTPARIADDLGRFVGEAEGRSVDADACRATASVFLGTYSKPDALGGLGILRPSGEGGYLVEEATPPDLSVFAYVLADYWHGVWGEVASVNLTSVTGFGGPAALLLLSSGDANRMLRDLQEQGFVEVHRRVPPYQVTRLWRDPGSLLERVYAS